MNLLISDDVIQIAAWSKEAIWNHLYSGELYNWYREPSRIGLMAVAVDNHAGLVGTACQLRESMCWVGSQLDFGVYVKQMYRRRGLGTKLDRLVESKAAGPLLVDRGSEFLSRLLSASQSCEPSASS